ncbi:MAG: NUDIX hydrolase [Acidimicrobiales bacterium]
MPGSDAPWAGLGSDQQEVLTLEHARRCFRTRNRANADNTDGSDRADGRGNADFRGAGHSNPGDSNGVDGSVLPCSKDGGSLDGVDRLGTTQRWDRSAVLIGLYEENGDVRTILTRRSAELRSHGGEVCFPGGRMEPGESPQQAAIREAGEEIGLDSAGIEVLGSLATVYTRSSMSSIVPVVAVLPAKPQLSASSGEVARLFDVGLADLLQEGAFHEELWAVEEAGPRIGVHFFDVADEIVWGATARMLVELLSVLTG